MTRAAKLGVGNPGEGLDRIRARLEVWNEHAGPDGAPQTVPHLVHEDWLGRLHQLLGVSVPCSEATAFDALWERLAHSDSMAGARSGTGHDADVALARAVWCCVRHLEPARVVETGVARGVTSFFVLEGLERSGRGSLWSIDLPPLREPWTSQVAVAVPDDLRARWTYLRGSSRRTLRPVLQRLASIDMFIHDSLHTRRNMNFELQAAWRVLRPGGIVIADDVEGNDSFSRLLARSPEGSGFVARHEDKRGLFGVALKPRSAGVPTEALATVERGAR
jgi:hypothetical protein